MADKPKPTKKWTPLDPRNYFTTDYNKTISDELTDNSNKLLSKISEGISSNSLVDLTQTPEQIAAMTPEQRSLYETTIKTTLSGINEADKEKIKSFTLSPPTLGELPKKADVYGKDTFSPDADPHEQIQKLVNLGVSEETARNLNMDQALEVESRLKKSTSLANFVPVNDLSKVNTDLNLKEDKLPPEYPAFTQGTDIKPPQSEVDKVLQETFDKNSLAALDKEQQNVLLDQYRGSGVLGSRYADAVMKGFSNAVTSGFGFYKPKDVVDLLEKPVNMIDHVITKNARIPIENRDIYKYDLPAGMEERYMNGGEKVLTALSEMVPDVFVGLGLSGKITQPISSAISNSNSLAQALGYIEKGFGTKVAEYIGSKLPEIVSTVNTFELPTITKGVTGILAGNENFKQLGKDIIQDGVMGVAFGSNPFRNFKDVEIFNQYSKKLGNAFVDAMEKDPTWKEGFVKTVNDALRTGSRGSDLKKVVSDEIKKLIQNGDGTALGQSIPDLFKKAFDKNKLAEITYTALVPALTSQLTNMALNGGEFNLEEFVKSSAINTLFSILHKPVRPELDPMRQIRGRMVAKGLEQPFPETPPVDIQKKLPSDLPADEQNKGTGKETPPSTEPTLDDLIEASNRFKNDNTTKVEKDNTGQEVIVPAAEQKPADVTDKDYQSTLDEIKNKLAADPEIKDIVPEEEPTDLHEKTLKELQDKGWTATDLERKSTDELLQLNKFKNYEDMLNDPIRKVNPNLSLEQIERMYDAGFGEDVIKNTSPDKVDGLIAGKEKPVVTKEEPLSSTQVNIPEVKPFTDYLKKIDDKDVYTEPDGRKGKETEPHITALYGLKTTDPKEVQNIVKEFGDVTVKLGKTSIFKNDNYDVLKVDVESKDLKALNKQLKTLDYKNDFPDYTPHLTLAYLKSGTGDKYAGDTTFEGKEFKIKDLIFSDPERNHTPIELTKVTPPVPPAGKKPTKVVSAVTKEDKDKAAADLDALLNPVTPAKDNKPPKTSERYNVVETPTNDISTDTKRFQNRDDEFSQKSVDKLLELIKSGEFNFGKYDPVRIWVDPKDNKTYALNHSRLEAFKQAQALGIKGYETIPTIKFEGTEKQAMDYAKKESNTLGTAESLVERAKIYRDMRKEGKSEKEIMAESKKNEQKNNMDVYYLSFLKPKGSMVQTYNSLDSASSEVKARIQKMASAIGRARKEFDKLTDQHEEEIYTWLNKKKDFSYDDLRTKLKFLEEGSWDFDYSTPLNLENKAESVQEAEFRREVSRIKGELKAAEKDLEDTRETLALRKAKDKTITDAEVEAALEKRRALIRGLQDDLVVLNGKLDKYLDAAKDQEALFSARKEWIDSEDKGSEEVKQIKEQTPAFLKWFSGSKIVNPDGSPMVMYNGNDRNIEQFRDDRMAYFTPDPLYANMYTAGSSAKGAHYVSTKEKELEAKTKAGPNIMPVYLSMKQPFDTRNDKEAQIFYSEFYGKYGNGTPLDSQNGLIDWTDAEDMYDFLKQKRYKYDGLILADSHGNISYAVFKPIQIKSATGNNGAYSLKNKSIIKSPTKDWEQKIVDPFYSQLERIAEQKIQNNATPDQIRATLLKSGLVKQAEWDDIGMDDYLEGKSKVDKADLMDFIQANKLQMKEVVKGDDTEYTDEEIKQMFLDADPENSIEGLEVWEMSIWLSENTHPMEENTGTTKYSQYSLAGGDKYKERLFILPEKTLTLAEQKRYHELEDLIKVEGDKYGLLIDKQRTSKKYYKDNYPPTSPVYKKAIEKMNKEKYELGDKISDLEAELRDLNIKYEQLDKQTFNTSHFNEKNVIMHERDQELKTVSGEKVLNIEEGQSDLHQQGRKKGYKGDIKFEIPAGFTLVQDLDLYKENVWLLKNPEGIVNARIDANSREEALKKLSEMKAYDGVPNFPLKKNWHEVILKRMIRIAAENGYKKLTWTKGQDQADRYSLSKQVEKIIWNNQAGVKGGRDLKKVSIFIKDTGARHELWVEGSGIIAKSDVTPWIDQSLDAVIGKEIAKRIMENNPDDMNHTGTGVIKGEGLNIGGKGMIGFYDKIWVDFANKLGKKYGVRVGEEKVRSVKDIEYFPDWVRRYYPNLVDKEGTEEFDRIHNEYQSITGKETTTVHSIELTPNWINDLLYKWQALYSPTGEWNSENPIVKNLPDIIEKYAQLGMGKIEDVAAELTNRNMKDVLPFLPDAYREFLNRDLSVAIKNEVSNEQQIKDWEVSNTGSTDGNINNQDTGEEVQNRARTDAADRRAKWGLKPTTIYADEANIPAPEKEYISLDRFTGSDGKPAIDEHQRFAANLAIQSFLNGKDAFGLFDTTGFGKTRQMLAIAKYWMDHSKKPILLISPNKQVINKSYKKDAKSMRIALSQFEVGTYDDLRLNKVGGEDYGLVLFDESQNLKNVDALKTIAAKKIISDHTVYVSATPMDDPKAAIYFLNKITGKSVEEIMRRLGLRYEEDEITGKMELVLDENRSETDLITSLLDLRNTAIRSGTMIRREMPFWGEIHEKYITPNNQQEFLSMQADIFEFYRKKINGILNSPIKESSAIARAYGQARANELMRLSESFKIDHIFEDALQLLSDGYKPVIFGKMINPSSLTSIQQEVQGFLGEMAKRFERAGIPFSKLYGYSTKLKEQAMDDFQGDKTDVILVTPESGGVGIDLDDQNYGKPRAALVGNTGYSGIVFIQSVIGRISRKKSTSPSKVFLYYDTASISDNRRQEILAGKIRVTRALQEGIDIDTMPELRDNRGEVIIRRRNNYGSTEPTSQENIFSPVKGWNDEEIKKSRIESGLDKDLKPELMAIHNLTTGNLEFAIRMGGFAMPSIAITKAKLGFEKYGEISLIGSKELIDPSQGIYNGVEVHSRDLYSPTYPRVYRHVFTTALHKLLEKIKSSFPDVVNEEMRFSLGWLKENTENGYYAPWSLGQTDAMKMYYLKETNQLPEFTMRPEKLWKLPEFKGMHKFTQELVKKYPLVMGIPKDDPKLLELKKKQDDAYAEHMAANRQDDNIQKKYWAAEREYEVYRESFEDQINAAVIDFAKEYYDKYVDVEYKDWGNNIIEKGKGKGKGWNDVTKQDHRDAIDDKWNQIDIDHAQGDIKRLLNPKEEFNKYAYSDIVDKIVNKQTEPYKEFLEKTFHDILGNEYLLDGRKKISNTLENAKMIMGTKVKGTEKTMVHGLGKAAVDSAIFFGTLDEIRAENERLVKREIFEQKQKELTDAFDSLNLSHYHTSYRADAFGFDNLDALSKTVGQIARTERMTDQQIRKITSKNGYSRIPDYKYDDLRNVAKLMKDMPTEYFEAKRTDNVSLNQFKAAIVPNNTNPDVLQALSKAGLKIGTYNPNIPEDRQNVTEDILQEQSLLFSPVKDWFGKVLVASALTLNPAVTDMDVPNAEAKGTKIEGSSENMQEYNSEPIKIEDTRTVDVVSGKPITDKNKLSSDADPDVIREIVGNALNNGLDPYTMLAMAFQETGIVNGNNPFHIARASEVINKHGGDPIQAAVEIFKEKQALAKRLGKTKEADIIQGWNGYGKISPKSEYGGHSYYGIDVSKTPLDMNTNPVYGNRVLDIRENIIKKNPFIIKLVNDFKSGAFDNISMQSPSKNWSNDIILNDNFKKWFGDSKVVDKQGYPLAVYHGSPDLSNFKQDHTFKTAAERYLGEGLDKSAAYFFTDHYQTAKSYADPYRAFEIQRAEEGVETVYLSMQNPLRVDAGGEIWRKFETTIDGTLLKGTREIVAYAKEKGYDGVIVKNVKDRYNGNDKKRVSTGTVYTVFNPNNIKSVSKNNGDYSLTNNSIIKSPADEWNGEKPYTGAFGIGIGNPYEYIKTLEEYRAKMLKRYMETKEYRYYKELVAIDKRVTQVEKVIQTYKQKNKGIAEREKDMDSLFDDPKFEETQINNLIDEGKQENGLSEQSDPDQLALFSATGGDFARFEVDIMRKSLGRIDNNGLEQGTGIQGNELSMQQEQQNAGGNIPQSFEDVGYGTESKGEDKQITSSNKGLERKVAFNETYLARTQKLMAEGQIIFNNGRPIDTAEDLGYAIQVLRDPRMETFRTIYLDGINKYINSRAISSNFAGMVILPPAEAFAKSIEDDIVRLNAETLVETHNHPVGDPTASFEDLESIQKRMIRIPKLKYHIIGNHGKFTVITRDIIGKDLSVLNGEPDWDHKFGKMYDLNLDEDYLMNFDDPKGLLKKQLSAHNLVDFAKKIQMDSDVMTIVGLGPFNQSISYNEQPITFADNLPALKELLRDEYAKTGAVHLIIGTASDTQLSAVGFENVKYLIENNMLLDIVDNSKTFFGEISYRNKMQIPYSQEYYKSTLFGEKMRSDYFWGLVREKNGYLNELKNRVVNEITGEKIGSPKKNWKEPFNKYKIGQYINKFGEITMMRKDPDHKEKWQYAFEDAPTNNWYAEKILDENGVTTKNNFQAQALPKGEMYYFKKAIKQYGTTDNWFEAGYILPDGELLDFSGKKEGGTEGKRSYDHREIGSIDDDMNMNAFIGLGAIRFMPEAKGFYMTNKPTSQQFSMIREFIDEYGSDVLVELDDRRFFHEYEKYTPAEKVIQDIKNYFDYGTVPSEMRGYMYSPAKNWIAPAPAVTTDAFKKFMAGSVVRKIMYHSTRADFDEFKIGDIGFHVGTIEHANNRIGDINKSHEINPKGENIMALWVNIKNPITLPDIGSWDHEYTIADELQKFPKLKKAVEELRGRMDKDGYNMPLTPESLQTLLNNFGYDGIRYKNKYETNYRTELEHRQRKLQAKLDVIREKKYKEDSNKEYAKIVKANGGERYTYRKGSGITKNMWEIVNNWNQTRDKIIKLTRDEVVNNYSSKFPLKDLQQQVSELNMRDRIDYRQFTYTNPELQKIEEKYIKAGNRRDKYETTKTGDYSYIVFNSNQLKSATGNNGDYSSHPSIIKSPSGGWPMLPQNASDNFYENNKDLFVRIGMFHVKQNPELSLGEFQSLLINEFEKQQIPFKITDDYGKELYDLAVQRYAQIGERKAEAKVNKLKERKFTKRFMASDEQSERVKAEITNSFYKEVGNKETADKAVKLLDDEGIDVAMNRILTDDPEILGEVKVAATVLIALRNKNEEDLLRLEGRLIDAQKLADRTADLIDYVTEHLGTAFGRTIQAFTLLNKLTASGWIRKLKKALQLATDGNRENIEQQTETLTEQFNGLNAEEIENLINSLESEKRELIKQLFGAQMELEEAQKHKLTDEEKQEMFAEYNSQIENLHGLFNKLKQDKQMQEEGMRKQIEDYQKQLQQSEWLLKELQGRVKEFEDKDKAITLINTIQGTIKDQTDRIVDMINKGEGHSEDIKQQAKTLKDQAKRMDDAATRLARKVIQSLKPPKKAELPDEVKLMVKTLWEIAKENKLVPEAQPMTRTKLIEIVGMAVKRSGEYSDVWDTAKEVVMKKLKSEPEKIKILEDYFNHYLENPFSEKEISSIVKTGIKELNINLTDIVKQHYTVVDAAKKSLLDKLLLESSVEGEATMQAIQKFVDAQGKKWEELTEDRRIKILENQFKISTKKAKEMYQKIIEWVNLGAFDKDQFRTLVADKLGVKIVTPEMIAQVKKLADAIQKLPDNSIQQSKAIKDMLDYIKTQKGIKISEVGWGLWYSSILSGMSTQIKNFTENTLLKLNGITNRDPREIPSAIKGIINGIQVGWPEFKATMGGHTPRHLTRGKYEESQGLELVKFAGGNYNPLSWAKYVGRLLKAVDVMDYYQNQEMEAYGIAYQEAKKSKLKGQAFEDEMNRILNGGKLRVTDARLQAENEGLSGIDFARRVNQILENGRTADIRKESESFGLFNTFNNRPIGVAGAIARAIQSLQKSKAGRFSKIIVPFTNIVANVFNMQLNFTPVGILRGAYGYYHGFDNGKGGAEKLTKRQQWEYYLNALKGTLLFMLLGYLMFTDGEDGKPLLEVTANGITDAKKRAQLMSTGWKPYSIRMFGRYIPYDYISPALIPLLSLGILQDNLRYKKDNEDISFLSRMETTILLTISSVMDKSFMSGIADLFRALDPNRESVSEKYLSELGLKTVSAVMPNFVKQLKYMWDPNIYEANSFTERFIRNVGIGQSEAGLKPKLNVLGEPVVTDWNRVFVYTGSKAKNDPVWNWIIENGCWIPTPDKDMLIYDKALKQDRKMTDDEYYDFVKARGSEIKKSIENNLEKLNKLPQDEKRKARDVIVRTAGDNAMLRMTGHSDKVSELNLSVSDMMVNSLQKKIKENIRSGEEGKNVLVKADIEKRLSSGNLSADEQKDIQRLLNNWDKYTKMQVTLSNIDDAIGKAGLTNSDGKPYNYILTDAEKENFIVDWKRVGRRFSTENQYRDDKGKLHDSMKGAIMRSYNKNEITKEAARIQIDLIMKARSEILKVKKGME